MLQRRTGKKIAKALSIALLLLLGGVLIRAEYDWFGYLTVGIAVVFLFEWRRSEGSSGEQRW